MGQMTWIHLKDSCSVSLRKSREIIIDRNINNQFVIDKLNNKIIEIQPINRLIDYLLGISLNIGRLYGIFFISFIVETRYISLK